MNYNWPGNVRELENCVQRALVLGSGHFLEAKDLPSPLFYTKLSEGEGAALIPLKEIERKAIMEGLVLAGGDRLRAAKMLGIGKTTIYRKLRLYGLDNFMTLSKSA